MDGFVIGDVRVHRVEEWQGSFIDPATMFVGYDEAAFRRRQRELIPDFYRPAEDKIYGFVQSWVLEADGRKILFDTCSGNGKDRPGIPLFGNLQSGYLNNLARAGFWPEDIDLVICSHLHIDHVGWNTRMRDGHWLPTFPNATYLLPEIDRHYWDPGQSRPTLRGRHVNQNVFEDSIQPILDYARYNLVGDGYRISSGLRLAAAPGHTPGHLFLKLESSGDHAFFIGDVMHHPIQVYYPEWNSMFCEDPDAARRTRKAILAEAEEKRALVIPAHFAGRHAVRIASMGNGYRPLY